LCTVFENKQREPPREYLDRESHYVWGKRYLLQVIESNTAPAVELKHSKMLLRVRPGTGEEKRQAIVDEWYRARKEAAGVAWNTFSSTKWCI
jgi:hypothetical protein